MPRSTVPQTSTSKSTSKVTTLPQTLESAREEMNREFCLIERLPGIAVIPTPDDPELHVYSRGELIQTICSDRVIEGKNVASAWMLWPKRNKARSLTYAPGKPQFHNGNLNTWIRSRIEPIKGDLTLWNEYLAHIFSSDESNRKWLLQWLAYQFQHPGVKMFSAVVFWSKETATGKSLFGYIMAELFGHHNFSEINEGELHGNFNHWAARKQFVMGEEIKGSNAQRHADALKAIITRKFVTINTKNTPHYVLPDCINYFFTSNHAEAFYLDNTDRRFFVHQLPEKKLSGEWVHNTFRPWLENGGYSAILYWLLNEVDVSDFSPTSAAPHTAARKNMIEANRSEAETWLEGFIDNLDAPLIVTLDDMWNSYHAATKSRESVARFKRWIKPFLIELYGGNQVRVEGMGRLRLFAVNSRDSETSGDNGETKRLVCLSSEDLSHEYLASRDTL